MDVKKKLFDIIYYTFHSSLVTYLISMLLVFFMPLTIHSQNKNNPFEIDNECYQYMLKVNKKLSVPVATSMCDTLIAIARKKKDVKAECISYSLRATYYLLSRDKRLIDEFPKFKAIIAKTPHLQYLYFIWCLNVDYYDKLGLNNQALRCIEDMKKDAIARNDNYGIAKSYEKIGSLFYNQKNHVGALHNLLRAYELYKESKDKNIYVVERMIAYCYICLSKNDEGIKMMKQCVEHTPKAYLSQSLVYYLNMISLLPEKSYDGEFEKIKSQIDTIYKVKNSRNLNDTYFAANRLYYTKKGMYDKAIENIKNITNQSYRERALFETYKEMGKWDSAFVYSQLSNKWNFNLRKNNHSTILTNASISIDSSQIAVKNKQLEIESLLEKQRYMELQSEQNILTIENAELELANKNHEYLSQKQQAELHRSANKINKMKLDQQLQKHKKLELEHERDKMQFITISSILLLLLLVATIVIMIVIKSKREVAEERNIADKARDKAERADKLKSLFLQNMSHEIRTPLNAIIGFSDILATPEVSEMLKEQEQSNMNHLIKLNNKLLLKLINDILDMSKLESGTYKMALSDVDVNVLCKETLKSVDSNVQSGVGLQLKIPQQSVTLTTDKERLQQVLINLLSNACKNTTEGNVTLGYEEVVISEKQYLRFFVEDTGCGIPEEKRASVFERFEKLDTFKQGTGLGLSICQLIAKVVSGYIYIDPSYNNGARFIFEHPMTYNKI